MRWLPGALGAAAAWAVIAGLVVLYIEWPPFSHRLPLIAGIVAFVLVPAVAVWMTVTGRDA